MIVQTEGIVLKSFDYRETSRIATFFTKDHGKVSGVMKGIRKDSRKFGSSVERFSVNDIVYYRYRHSDLHLISQCDLSQFFYPVRQDLKKSLAANYALELVDKIMPTEGKNGQVYSLLMSFLGNLADFQDVSYSVYIFQIKILLYSGFQPHLDACLKCKQKIVSKACFSLKDGGLICLPCESSQATDPVISNGTVASLLHIERNSWANCAKLKLTELARKELKYLLNNFLVYHIGRKIKSAKYLH